MSQYDHHNKAFDYAPPERSGSASGALLLVGGIIALFFLAMLFLGSGGPGTVPEEGAAPAVAPADGAPAVEAPAPATDAAPAITE